MPTGRQSHISHHAGGSASGLRAVRRGGGHLHTQGSLHTWEPRIRICSVSIHFSSGKIVKVLGLFCFVTFTCRRWILIIMGPKMYPYILGVKYMYFPKVYCENHAIQSLVISAFTIYFIMFHWKLAHWGKMLFIPWINQGMQANYKSLRVII